MLAAPALPRLAALVDKPPRPGYTAVSYTHLDVYKRQAQPYAGLTVPVDITDFYQAVEARKVPFFLSFLYCCLLYTSRCV